MTATLPKPKYMLIFETVDGSPCDLSMESRDGLSKHFHAALANETIQPSVFRVQGKNVVRVERLNPLTPNQMVKEFHETYGHPVLDTPTVPVPARENLRLNLLAEELMELEQSMDMYDMTAEGQRAKLVAIADALGDLLYVTYGAAHEYGIDLDAVVAEVHASNMRKLGPDGKPIYREDGKILKPDDWKGPNIEAVLFPEAVDEDETDEAVEE